MHPFNASLGNTSDPPSPPGGGFPPAGRWAVLLLTLLLGSSCLLAEGNDVELPALVRERNYVRLENAYRFEADIPDAEVVIIEDCGHAPQEEKPEEVIPVLKAFLGAGSPYGKGSGDPDRGKTNR